MNFTPESYPSPPPVTGSESDGHTLLGATSSYAPSMYATSVDLQSAQQLVGLGISHIGVESCASETEPYPRPALPALSTYAWSNTFIQPENFLQPSQDYSFLTPPTLYEPLGGLIEAATSPSSFYGSHTFSTSPSYGSSIESEGRHDTGLEEGSNTWPRTPTSESANVPVDYILDGELGKLRGPSMYENLAQDSASALSQMPPVPISDAGYGFPWSQIDNNGGTSGLTPDQATVLGSIPSEVISRWIEEVVDSPAGELKIPSASGLQCSVCGFRFTRRSNCREHEKRHNPQLRKSFPCALCGKAYGRNTDLRRHVQSTHLQERKFCCEQCGQTYSRQDTLNRHKTDGCPRKARKCNRS
ncbi:putative C2H2 finger domain protein (Ezf) [Aspergillus saccharolyticus JOP 1030-1]|uniref:C2H2-type domain-containing protein n=1 Tax=Aspergillus saccharolyticus JOP 1030-1 TaxID=1450539 RepID=A0A318ZPS4_9EURO|nr:hypothetical protein BP01DRAFT_79906 [Aspergillus saccharolyticus JOP 1030-1]PYH49526.1 hypothetical protein BP01DRAFT_79906 [Aspergillus saccharolyticus JOP 1030-1]